jgi:hypothetical protein
MGDDTPSGAHEAAIQRIKRKRQFQYQVLIYVVINVLLWVLWAAADFGFPWPIFVTVGWGIGLGAQAWHIYGGGGRPITEAEIQDEMRKGGGAA